MSRSGEFIENLRARQTTDLDTQATAIRRQLLTDNGAVMATLLREQIEQHQIAEPGNLLDYKVVRDDDRAPFSTIGVGRACISFMMQGRNFRMQRDERLRILIPTARNFDTTDPEQVHAIEHPEEIYTERSTVDSVKKGVAHVYSRQIIAPEGAMLYTVDEVDLAEQMRQPDFEQLLYGKVQERLSDLGRLSEDLVNWTIEVQRRSVEGLGKVEDL